MVTRFAVYKFCITGGMVLTGIGAFAAYTGNAEALVSASQLPGGVPYAFGVVAVAAIVGRLLIGAISKRAWKATGRKTGLTPESGGLLGKPDLTGEIDGRSVRAKTVKRKTSGGGENGSSSETYTVVESNLTESTDEGLMIARTPPDEATEGVDFGETTVGGTVVDDRFTVVGSGDEGLARELLSNRARNALLALEDPGTLSVGDPTDSLMDAMPDMGGSFIGNAFEGEMEETLESKTAGERTTAAIQTESVVRDPDRLERQARAVAAIADAHEAAIADAATA